MTFKSQLTSDLSIFYNSDEFAETVSYTPVGGAARDITAIVTRQGSRQEPYIRGEFTALAEIEVKKSEVTNPQHGDTYVFDSQTWEHSPRTDIDADAGVIYEDSEEHIIALRRVD